MEKGKYPVGCKIVVVGAANVGKTTFIIQSCCGKFVEDYDPTISDSWRKRFDMDGQEVIVDYEEIATQTEFEALRKMLYMQCDGVIVLYSITDYDSFSEVSKFVEEIKNLRVDDGLYEPSFLIFANKGDLEDQRKVSSEHAKELERTLKIPVVEGSCKQNEVVTDVVRRVAMMVLKEREKMQASNNTNQNQRKRNSRRPCIIM